MIAGGGPRNFLPAAMFVVNEVATMLPRALQGKRWYLKKFGEKAPKERKAVIPGVL
jgi:3-oxo-5-alpha-steroid 4-dehydrogenase 1